MISNKRIVRWAGCLFLSGALSAPAWAQESGIFQATLEIASVPSGACTSNLDFGGFILTQPLTSNVEVQINFAGDNVAPTVSGENGSALPASLIKTGTPTLALCSFAGASATDTSFLVNGGDSFSNTLDMALSSDSTKKTTVTIWEQATGPVDEVEETGRFIRFRGAVTLTDEMRLNPGRYSSAPIVVTIAE